MGVHTFRKGICLKVNLIAKLEFELAYYDSAVHRFNHYTTKTLLLFGGAEGGKMFSMFERLFGDTLSYPRNYLSDFVALIKEKVLNVRTVHCVLYRNYLVAKKFNGELHDVFKVCIRPINEIKVHPCNS